MVKKPAGRLTETIYQTILQTPGVTPIQKADAYLGLAKIQDRLHDARKAEQFITQGYQQDPQHLQMLHWFGGFLGNRLQDRPQAIRIYRELHQLAQEKNAPVWEVQALIGLGNARDGDNKLHYREALRIAQQINDFPLQVQALIGLGNAHSAARENRTAFDYFEEARRIAPSRELANKAQAGMDRASRFLRPPSHSGGHRPPSNSHPSQRSSSSNPFAHPQRHHQPAGHDSRKRPYPPNSGSQRYQSDRSEQEKRLRR